MKNKSITILSLILTLVAMIILYFNSDMENNTIKIVSVIIGLVSLIFILLTIFKKDK